MKVYADRRGLCTSGKLIDEKFLSQVKHFTHELKGDKKMKHSRGEPCSRVSSSRSIISHAMRWRIPKIQNFPAFRNQSNTEQVNPQREIVLPLNLASASVRQHVAPAVPTTQNELASNRNRRSPSYCSFESSYSDSIAAPSKQPQRAGDTENFQTPSVSVVEMVLSTANQLPKEDQISPSFGAVSPPDPRV